MKKRMEEQSLRTVALAAVGFVALLVAVPEWARAGVVVFGAIYAVLVYVLDANVRSWIPDHRRRSGVRDDTVTSPRAKSPAARRAAI